MAGARCHHEPVIIFIPQEAPTPAQCHDHYNSRPTQQQQQQQPSSHLHIFRFISHSWHHGIMPGPWPGRWIFMTRQRRMVPGPSSSTLLTTEISTIKYVTCNGWRWSRYHTGGIVTIPGLHGWLQWPVICWSVSVWVWGLSLPLCAVISVIFRIMAPLSRHHTAQVTRCPPPATLQRMTRHTYKYIY